MDKNKQEYGFLSNLLTIGKWGFNVFQKLASASTNLLGSEIGLAYRGTASLVKNIVNFSADVIRNSQNPNTKRVVAGEITKTKGLFSKALSFVKQLIGIKSKVEQEKTNEVENKQTPKAQASGVAESEQIRLIEYELFVITSELPKPEKDIFLEVTLKDFNKSYNDYMNSGVSGILGKVATKAFNGFLYVMESFVGSIVKMLDSVMKDSTIPQENKAKLLAKGIKNLADIKGKLLKQLEEASKSGDMQKTQALQNKIKSIDMTIARYAKTNQ